MANNSIQKATAQQAAARDAGGRKTLQQYIKTMMPEIKKALPSVMTPERFSRIVLSAVSTNPRLQETTPQSFLGAMMTAAQLGVEPNTPLGQAYLIPFRNHGIMECQFQLGYRGMIDLAYRSGEVSSIMAQVVYENDDFEYSFGLEPQLKHVPARANRGNPAYVYAVFRTKDGGFGYDVMSIEDVRLFAQKKSKSYEKGPWQTDFGEMAKKTVLKRVLKYAPLKSEFARQIAQDETIKTEISEDMYDVIPVEYEQEEEPKSANIKVDPETGEILPDDFQQVVTLPEQPEVSG